MNGLKRAKILSYNAKGRTAQVHIHGLTESLNIMHSKKIDRI